MEEIPLGFCSYLELTDDCGKHQVFLIQMVQLWEEQVLKSHYGINPILSTLGRGKVNLVV